MPQPVLHSRHACTREGATAPRFPRKRHPGDGALTEDADWYWEIMMFTTNPFTPLTNFVSPEILQGYIVLMMLAVAIGTGFDLIHDSKAKFFLLDRKRAKAAAK